MQTTAQERLALSVVALLIAAGAGVRLTQTPPPPPEWVGEEDAPEEVAALQEEVAEEIVRVERAAKPLAAGEKIDPNTATRTELDRLPRIGPALAERIVEHRESNGPFRSVDDLDAVSGIGPALLAAIAPHVNLPVVPARSAAPAASPAWRAAPPATNPAASLDLNTATAEELDALPGIGPTLAERIVRWRAENGRFRSVDELDQVSGIGPHTLERLAPLVRAGS